MTGSPCDFEGTGMRCSGWYVSEDDDRLDLFLVVPMLDGAAGTVAKAEIDNAFRRLKTFFTRSIGGPASEGSKSALTRYRHVPWNLRCARRPESSPSIRHHRRDGDGRADRKRDARFD